MNKTTTLVLAAIAGFGLSAQAKQQTDTLWDVGFDAITISADKVPLSEVTNHVSFTTYGKWDLSSEDNESYVTNGLVGSSSSQFLVLDTNGNELKWTPDQTGTGTVSIVESDIYFVGADDAPPPEGFDSVSNPAQTAMYLLNVYEDGEGVTQDEPQSYELYIWTWSETLNTNAWQKLDSAVTNENWHHVQILIDYEKSTPKVSVAVNGIVAADPSDPTVTSWTAASRGGNKTAVQTVSFKGTGRVDNFAGRSRVTSFDKAFFGAEVYVDGVKQPVGSEGNTTRYTAEKQEIGDVDNELKSVTFSKFAFDNFESGEEPIALSRITIITNGIETVYDYSGYYDSENGEFTGVPDGYPAEFALDKSGDQTGEFSISPLTHGATKGDVTNIVAKIYINTLDAYFASAVCNIGETTTTDEKFVKPSAVGTTVSWTFPNTTNGTYVLSSVVVANGAAFDSATGIASFTVPEGGIGADKTYVTATYVEGDYSVPESYGWTYDENTGTYTHAVKTFTVTWVSEGATLATYTGVPYGTTTNYVGETPTKASAGGYDYTFAGWSPAVGPVTANTTYTAQFDGTLATIIVISANGATTNGYETLPAAFAAAADGETVALLANVNLDGRVFVNAGATPTYSANGRYATSSDNRSLTLDLNGHCITNSSNIALAGGSLTITNTSDTASVIATTASGLAPVEVRGTGDLASKRTLAVGPNVTLSGPCYGLNVFGSNDTQLNKIDVTVDGTVDGMLFVLGNLKNTANEINVVVNGTVDASNAVGEEKVHTGIAQAGYSTVTVNDGAVVTGESGIETRAGSLVVNGGTITATAPASSYEANGSGMTTKGAAIAVAQHGTALPMSTTLNGGTLSGAESIVVTDVNDNNLGNVEVVATENFAEDATVPEGYSWIEDEVTGDYVLTKVWVVTYANYDGTALQVTTNVTGATTPAYAGATPVKPDDATYTYAFTGWSPAAAATVTADATYTAQFSATEKPQGTILVISANGAVTNLSETLAAAVAAVEDGGKIVLTDDQNAGASRIQVSNKSFTVDLNGQTLSSSEADNIIFRVSGGQTIQIEGTTPGSTFVGSVMIAGSTEGHIAVNGGTYTNDLYCPFYANGTCSAASSIAITNATIVAVDAEAGQPGADSETGFGLYVAGPAATTLKDTTIVADKTGVEIRAGSLVVDGGSITAGDTFSTAANGNGGTVYGAAISVSPHNTNKPIAVEVNGGTFTAAKAVYENYLQPQARTAETAVTLNGGSFIGEVDIVEDIGTVIPSTSTALFSDSGAEGVEDGYGLQEDPENPGLYKVVKTYVVTYANYDGAALQVTTNFVNETTPAYAGATPVKPSDSQYDYTFTGWSPAVAETVAADATYTAQFSRKENGTVIVITDAGATTNYFATLQAALDAVKENNLQQANIELLADASITISRNGNVLGGNSTTNITINGNNHELHVVRDGTWAQFNTANGATLVLEDVDLTSEFTGTQTGWVGDTLQNPNHNIAFNCDVELKNVDSDTALSFWKDADLDTVTIAETVDVYSIWIHTTASNVAIKDLVVDSPNGRGIKVDDSFVKYAGTPSASTAISIDGASFTTKNKKSAVLVRSAYPIDITTAGTIDISNVPADTQHLVWVDEDASEKFGLVTLDGAQSGLGVEGGASSYAASLTTNAWIAGYYKVLADAVEVATAADKLDLLATSAETFTVSKPLTITRNGFSANGVTAGEGYERTDTAETYVFAEEPTGTVIVITDAGATTNYYATLQAAVDAAPAGATVVLLADNEASRVTVEKNLVIDLGGHTYTGRLSMFDGNVVVTNGTVAGRFDVYDSSVVTLAANTTVDGYVIVWGDGVYGEAGCKTPTFNLYGTVRNNDPAADQYAISTSSDDDSRPVVNIYEGAVVETIWAGVGIRNGASLNMTGGSITAGEFGIYNNGSDTTPTTINVSGGTVTSTNEVNTACGIYQAGPGTLTISGSAVVSGPDAVEVRAGSVQVLDNAQLVATMPYTQPASNGNGNSGHGGVALLVSQHTTAQAVSAAVDGGTLTGEVAFQEATVETQNNPSLVTGAINAGAIDGEVLSEDIDDLIPSDSEALFADADAEGVEEGYGLKEDPTHPGLYVVTKTYVVVYANYDGAALQTTTNFVDDATPAYAGATPTKDEDDDYTYAFADAWSPTPDATVTSNATYVAQFTATPKQSEEHEGAKDGDGFVILDPDDTANPEHQPLTFTSIEGGTATISAKMLNPNDSTSVQLQVVYRTSLTGPNLYLPATVSAIDDENGTATVTWTQPNVDTFFLIGLANKAEVED